MEPYTPDIRQSQESLVVEGLLTDQPGIQTIYLSRSSPYSDPGFIPERDCLVRVVDENGNSYLFYDQGEGVYQRFMMASQLVRGTAYKLSILTTEGKEYESNYEILPFPCPLIDSVYFETETVGTFDPEQPLEGIQFYIDLDAEEDQARNYRWELVETWEYYAAHIITDYYDGELHKMDDPFKYHHCWYTGRISNIYTSSTKHSVSNRINRYPLYFVSNQTNRLKIRYSLLVKQFSLSDEAYQYWDQMRRQHQESGGLYETQPAQIRGNVYNINDPEELVLGFFNVASSLDKRIFVDAQSELGFPPIDCTLDTIYNMYEIPPPVYYPVYMRSLNPMGGPPYGVGRGICFDCTTEGGSTVKPDFWE
ncbi:MAG: hypothetical protein AMS27_14410 [Bacteroides sp. SM23_62_1]|nr:MAG: hypothetical protein AMS27_14410 [Bacteroides sp. SM23_62_1]